MAERQWNLGNHHWPVSTESDDAQSWFNAGLIWCYGYNHEEAIACFQRAIAHDSGLAIAHWGIAYAVGPNYNKPWDTFDPKDANDSLRTARQAVKAAVSAMNGASTLEQALISALEKRYPSDDVPTDFSPWQDQFAAAMCDVHASFGDHADVAALTAESLMTRTPWALWDLKSGDVAAGASTLEAASLLEDAIKRREDANEAPHPGLLHMYVHLMEMSPHPERALKAGDQLRGLVPDAGHLCHMPTHIDVLCGHYQTVVETNWRAVAADRRYLEARGPLNFYSLYRCHDYHFVIYGSMFLGQYSSAITAADEMIATLPEELLLTESPPMADWLEGFVSMRQHVLIRFGRWQEILDQPMPENADLFCVTTAMMRYARAVALAATGDVDAAKREADAFRMALKKVPDTRYVFNNTCLDILAVAEAMMNGEIAYRDGDFERAFAELRRSVELDDHLPYDEPWGWMQPTRHALGALLLERGRIEEALAVYRADLGFDPALPRACQHPDNVWSLHGLHECLTRLGKTEEAGLIKPRLDIARARTDVPVHASCFCRLEKMGG